MKKTFAFLSHLDANLYLFRAPIMKQLLSNGHKVYAICPKGDKNQALRDLGCEVVNYAIDRRSLNPFREKKSIDNIYHVIKNLNIDVLHTFTAKPNIYGTFAARKAGIPIVLNLVEGLGSFYVNNNVKKPYSPEKLHTIKSSLSLEGKIVVLMVARAIWDKGIREYYEVAQVLTKKYQDVAFVLVGGVDKGNPTSADESFLNSTNVKWLGQRDDIVDITAISDVYVLPSYREGLPVTLMEACAMGKPIVTTDTVGCRDVVRDGYNGYLVPVRDTQALAQKIELLIEDEKRRKIMGEYGRMVAIKEFDTKSVVKQYMKFYKTVGE